MSSLSVTSIAIPKPNIPVRNYLGRADFRVYSFTIWRSAQPKYVYPVSISMDSSGWTTLHVTIQGSITSSEGFTLSGKFLGTFLGGPIIKTPLTIEDTKFNSGNITVAVTLKGCLVNVPWGIKDTIEWCVNGQTAGETPIELYAITPHEYIPTYLKYEIPVELLQIFILPTLNLKVKTHEEFVKYTAIVCHKSSEDQEAVEKHKEYPPVHSYTYNNTSGGGSSFIGQNGGTFRFDRWMKNRFPIKNQIRSYDTVNCFDQAGLVTIVLALGLPDSSAELRWYVMTPYGYIEGDLVGVGKCNNPYFNEPIQKDNTQAGTKAFLDNPADPRRSGFSIHVFPAIVTKERGERILDACAGPRVGTDTLDEYIAAVIKTAKNSTVPADETKKAEPGTRTKFCIAGSRNDAKYYDGTPDKPYGVSSLNSNRITPWTSLSLSKSQNDFIDELAKKSKIPGAKSDDRMKEVKLGPLIKNLTAKLQKSGKKFAEPTKNITETNTHVEWSWVTSADEAITVEMIVGRYYSDAFDTMNNYLLSYTRPEVPLSMEGPGEKAMEANHYLTGPDVSMWVDSNIFVRVSRSSRDGKRSQLLHEITNDIHSLMSEAANNPNGQNSGDVVMNPVGPSKNPVVGYEFAITVEVSNGGEVEAIVIPKESESDTHPRVLVIEKKVKPVNNSATFWFLALSKGTLVVKFLCAHFETLEVSEKKFEVTIEPQHTVKIDFGSHKN